MNLVATPTQLAICWLILDASSLAKEPAEASFDRAAYARFAADNAGDSARGRTVFADRERCGCLKCHRVGKEGEKYGPVLDNVGAKLARGHLIEAVLEPSRQIVEGYRLTVLTLKSGHVLSGLVDSETVAELALVDANGERAMVSKADIEERAFGDTSPMPDNLVAKVSPAEFADLVAYLQSLRSSGQPTPGSGTIGPIKLPPGFRATPIVRGLTAATALAVLPDGRVLVCEQTGTLRVVKDDKLLPEPMLVLPVDGYWERGLIGVTVDPQFVENGWIYVCYVAKEPYPHHVISRFTVQRDRVAHGSELVLLEGDDQRKLGGKVPAGHQGGALHFGRDGCLYIGIGEQTAELPAQSLNTLQGKLLRIQRDGTIPADNPFVAQTEGKYRAIWGLGLRNPFTFAVHPRDGRILINDVGGSFEEINVGRAGANFGWPTVDHGKPHGDGFMGPIHTYQQASIAGGAFCPDDVFPLKYRGRYFFMDFVHGWIRTLDPDNSADVRDFASGLTRPVDLAFGPQGRLYVLLRDAWVIDDRFEPRTGALLAIDAE